MIKKRHWGAVATPIAALLALAGCSHAVFPNSGGGGGGSTAPLILTIHDAPPTGVSVTSFEVTVTGAVLQPGNVSLISTPQTVELTRLQTNSFLLAETTVALGNYTSLTVTYSNPQYTFINDTGVAITTPVTCAAGASCVVSSPTVTTATNTVSFSLNATQSTQTSLIEFDVNLNDVIQTDYSLNFSQSGGATIAQASTSSGANVMDTMEVNGQISSVTTSPANEFVLAASNGQSLTVVSTTGTLYSFGRGSCTANSFTCLAVGQIVDVNVNIMSDGLTLDAAEVDFDDASSTQQVSGTIVSATGTPPTSFQMVVHNTVPAVSSVPPGTTVTVTIGGAATYVVNNGLFVLPAGVSFASTSDVIVGQEVEARVQSGTSITGNAFTTDRLALEQTQLQAVVSTINATASPFPNFILSPLPPLFVNASTGSILQLEIADTSSSQTIPIPYQNITPANIGGLTLSETVTTGGFLFNTTGTIGSPSIIATVVRAEVAGT